jgi:AsmA family
MPLQRRLAILLTAIALAALAAVAVLWIGARTPFARGLIAGRITEATGMPCRLASLRLGFLPSPSLDLGGIRFDQPPGFGAEPLLEIGRLQVRLPWRSLLGVARLDAVEVSDATARLVVDRDGSANWSAFFGGSQAGGAPAQRVDWRVGELAFERGTIDYRDAAADAGWQLTAITIDAAGIAPRTEFPLELRLAGLFGPNTIHYAMKGRGRLDPDAARYEASVVDFRGWAGGEPLPLAGVELTGAVKHAVYEGATGVASFEAGRFVLAGVPGSFEGTVGFNQSTPAVGLRIATGAFEPRAPAIILGRPLPVTADPAAFGSLQLVLVARTEGGVLRIDPVSGRLDDTNFEGRVVPAERLIRASLDRIDLNRYLPPAAKTARGKKATLEDGVAALAAFDLDAEIRIAEARVADARIRDAVIRVERTGDHVP